MGQCVIYKKIKKKGKKKTWENNKYLLALITSVSKVSLPQ